MKDLLIKKGDIIDIGVKTIIGTPKLFVVRTVHKDNTVTLTDLFGKYYGRVGYDVIKVLIKS